MDWMLAGLAGNIKSGEVLQLPHMAGCSTLYSIPFPSLVTQTPFLFSLWIAPVQTKLNISLQGVTIQPHVLLPANDMEEGPMCAAIFPACLSGLCRVADAKGSRSSTLDSASLIAIEQRKPIGSCAATHSRQHSSNMQIGIHCH